MAKRCRFAAAVALVMALVLALAGCIGVETTMEFAADGSGTATMVYRVSQMVTKIGTGEGEQGGVPLPITEADFTRAVADAPGVSLVGDVKRSEDEENITMEAKLRFDRVESLAGVQGFGDTPATLTRDGDRWVFRQVITAGAKPGESIDPETERIVEALFSGYNVAFVIQAPADIKSASLGQVAGRTVRYSVAVPELLKMTERTELEVVW